MRFALIFLTLVVLALLFWANFPENGISPEIKYDSLFIDKSDRRLDAYSNGKLIKSYRVSLGRNPTGTKEREGDNRTPEGIYAIDFKKEDSAFHRALHINYPAAQDIANAQRQGFNPGGDIMIHGLRNGLGWIGRFHRLIDWTAGCVAVTNPEIEELFAAVEPGAVV